MSIESSGTGQSFIERFWEIGSGDNDDSFGLLESIKLDQELIECLFHVMLFNQLVPNIERGTHLILGTPLTSDCVQLIDKDDCWSLSSGSSEEFPNTFGYTQLCPYRWMRDSPPTPTNISSKLDPEANRKGTSASPATARANIVFPVPGGPVNKTPLGNLPPRAENFSGFLRNMTISSSSYS
jgi:hypothetical protein